MRWIESMLYWDFNAKYRANNSISTCALTLTYDKWLLILECFRFFFPYSVSPSPRSRAASAEELNCSKPDADTNENGTSLISRWAFENFPPHLSQYDLDFQVSYFTCKAAAHLLKRLKISLKRKTNWAERDSIYQQKRKQRKLGRESNNERHLSLKRFHRGNMRSFRDFSHSHLLPTVKTSSHRRGGLSEKEKGKKSRWK